MNNYILWIKDNSFIFPLISIVLASWPLFQKWQARRNRQEKVRQFQAICKNIIKSSKGGDCLYWPDKDLYLCPVCLYSENRITPVFEDEQSGYYTCDHCKSRRIFNRITVEIARQLAVQQKKAT